MGSGSTSWRRRILNSIRIRSELGRHVICEFYATFILSVIVHAAVAQDVVSRTGSAFNVALTVGMGVVLAVYAGFGVTGAHINLAVSIGIAVIGQFPWRRIPVYFLAQLVGGFAGAWVVYRVYEDGFDHFDGGTRQVLGENGTAGVFATFPQPYLSMTTGFFEQVLNTALLLASIGAVMDQRNNAAPTRVAPFFFGLIVFTILMSYGYNAGAPLNPSIDLSGRLFLTAAGYGREVWTPDGVHWWWIPIVGPIVGASLGSWAYFLAIIIHHPPEEINVTDYNEKIENIEHNNKDGMVNNHTTRHHSLTNSTTMSVRRRPSDQDEMSRPLSVDAIFHSSLENDATNDIYL
ncbi:aquaporin-10-like [Lytechinus variegatus]|uniref:aquaporin-10-like n=1 Tax=Lytechinus variegatus TaxID=7654 RepID=UPI001BB1C19F|nr:aquaporin-10-like [Lytechinus variegatus]